MVPDPVAATLDVARLYLDKAETGAQRCDWPRMIDSARVLREQAVALEHYAHLQLRSSSFNHSEPGTRNSEQDFEGAA